MSNLTIAPSTSVTIKQTTIQMQAFWRQISGEIREVNPELEDFKFQILPLSRIKRVMKLEDETRDEKCMISSEAPVVFAKACEIFILELSLRAWMIAEEGKRRTLLKTDLAKATESCELYDFLLDIVPREGTAPPLDERGYPMLAMGASTFGANPPIEIEIQPPMSKLSDGDGDKDAGDSSAPGTDFPFLVAKGVGISVTPYDPDNPSSYTIQLVNTTGESDGKVTATPVAGPLAIGLLTMSASEDARAVAEKRALPTDGDDSTEDGDVSADNTAKRARIDDAPAADAAVPSSEPDEKASEEDADSKPAPASVDAK